MTEFERMVDEVTKWIDEASEQGREHFKGLHEDRLFALHHTLGRKIRDEFKLWNTPHEPDVSLFHPDEISMRVIEAVWKKYQ